MECAPHNQKGFRKLSLFVFSIAWLVLLSACSRSEAVDDEKMDDETMADGSPPLTEVLETEIPATITLDGLWFRESLDASGTRQLEIGEVVHVIGEKEASPANPDRSYVPVRLADGTEGWASEWFTILNTTPGVLTHEARIYSEAKLTKLTTRPALPAMTIVAVGMEDEVDGFARISYSTAENYAKLNEYVKSEYVSQSANDILAAQLYTLAMNSEEEVQRNEFLKSASEISDSVFRATILEAINDSGEGLKPEYESVSGMAVIRETGVKAYMKPDIDSTVLKKFEVDESVNIVGRTKSKYLVGETEDWWYLIDEDGWIFGSDIDVDL